MRLLASLRLALGEQCPRASRAYERATEKIESTLGSGGLKHATSGARERGIERGVDGRENDERRAKYPKLRCRGRGWIEELRQERDEEDDALGVERGNRIRVQKQAQQGLWSRRGHGCLTRGSCAKHLEPEIQEVEPTSPLDDVEPECRSGKERAKTDQGEEESS